MNFTLSAVEGLALDYSTASASFTIAAEWRQTWIEATAARRYRELANCR
jgi:hypothetical protein